MNHHVTRRETTTREEAIEITDMARRARLVAALAVTAAALLGAPFLAAGAQPSLAAGRATTIDAAAAGAAPSATEPRRSLLRLEASLSDRRLVVLRDGEVLAEYDVAVGKPGYRTPTGSFTVERLIWNPGWVPPASDWARGKSAKGPGDPDNPMKVVKIFFREPDYYIHGTSAVDSLGEAASHGCLRMSPAEVAELARIVMEHGGDPRDDAWFTAVLGGTTTREVRLPLPVELVVSH